MNQKTFNVLGIAAAVMVVLAILIGSQSQNAQFDESAVRDLVRGLETASIASIKVTNGEDSVELTRSGKAFLVSSRLNYPAETKEISGLIDTVTRIRTSGVVTDDPADHADLGFAAGSEGLQTVEFFDADGKRLVGVEAVQVPDAGGPPGGGGFRVRLSGEPRVYTTGEYLQIRAKATDYVDTSLTQLERDDIAKVSVNIGSDAYTIVDPEDGDPALREVPEGKKAKDSEVTRVLTAAQSLTFTEFMPASEATGFTFDSVFVTEVRPGLEYTFELAEQAPDPDSDEGAAAKFYVRGRARYTGPTGQITIKEDDPKEELEKKEAILLARDAAAAFNETHSGWVYEVASWKANPMRKPLADLVEDDDGKPSEVAASHILIAWEGSASSTVTDRTKEEAETRAREVLAAVHAGEKTFEDLAREFSDGPTGPNGGSLGTFTFDKMAKPFSEAAFALEVGAISELVETQFGYHIIRRDS